MSGVPSDHQKLQRKNGKEIIHSQSTKMVGENCIFLKEETHWHEAEGCAL